MKTLDFQSALIELSQQRDASFISWAEAHKTSLEMDGRNQTRYDTQKEEWAGRANLIMAQIQRLDKVEGLIKNTMSREKKNIIEIGSSVELEMNGEIDPLYIFLLDDLGGGSLAGFDLISINSPLGNAILGKKTGDKVIYNLADQVISLKVISVS